MKTIFSKESPRQCIGVALTMGNEVRIDIHSCSDVPIVNLSVEDAREMARAIIKATDIPRVPDPEIVERTNTQIEAEARGFYHGN